MTPATGYIFYAVMAAVFVGISWWAYRRFKVQTVDELVAGGRRASLGIISASIMASWIWTLTILGSSEAGMWFGVGGGFQYAWGSIICFLVFMPAALRLRQIMPRASTFTEFVYERYGPGTHLLFFLFGTLVAVYVFVQQMLGAGILFNTMFKIPFPVGVLMTAALVTSYITIGGLRSSLLTDMLQFFVIGVAALYALPTVLSALGGPGAIFDGMQKVVSDPNHAYHNPEALSFWSGAGWRYGIATVIIVTGELLFDQGYYQRAVAASNTRTLKWGYILGGMVAWFPIPLAFGTILGTGGLATLGSGQISSTSEVAPYLMSTLLGPIGALLFATMIFMAACSTADTGMAGVQSLFTADLFGRYFRKQGSGEARQVTLGRWVTVLFGAICALVALALEGVSMLSIDIFVGILFSAPVSVFVAGLFWKKASARAGVPSMLIGLAAGLACWFFIPNQDLNWFIGNTVSLLLPAVLMVVLTLAFPDNFDFRKLKSWRPTHQTAVGDEESLAPATGD